LPGMGFSSPGMQMLLGNMLGGSFVNGGFQMQGGTAPMMQQVRQIFGGHQQQGAQTFSTWLSNVNHPTYQPDTSKSPIDQYHDLHRFARENGSRDGTPVADWTDSKQDLAAANHLSDLTVKQDNLFLARLKQAPLAERMAIAEENEKLRELADRRAAEGRPFSPDEHIRARIQSVDKLYQDGRIGAELGDTNRDLMTIQGCSMQTWANIFMKSGSDLPDGVSADCVGRSPYNPQNLQAQGARQDSRHAAA